MPIIKYNEALGIKRVVTNNDKVSCACCVPPCDFSGSDDGGGEPYSNTFQLDRVGIETTLEIYFNAIAVKDAITVTAGGQTFSSGCISGSVTHLLYLPQGAESVTVSVDPNCESPGYTAWSFSLACVSNAPP